MKNTLLTITLLLLGIAFFTVQAEMFSIAIPAIILGGGSALCLTAENF